MVPGDSSTRLVGALASLNCSKTKSTPLPALGFLVVGALRKYWRRNTRHVEYVIDQIAEGRIGLSYHDREDPILPACA
jgi:hypothetical protein